MSGVGWARTPAAGNLVPKPLERGGTYLLLYSSPTLEEEGGIWGEEGLVQPGLAEEAGATFCHP